MKRTLLILLTLTLLFASSFARPVDTCESCADAATTFAARAFVDCIDMGGGFENCQTQMFQMYCAYLATHCSPCAPQAMCQGQ